MTSKIVVNNIEPDAGISTVTVNGDLDVGDVTIGGNLGVGVITATQSSSNIGLDLHATSSGRGSQIKFHNDHGTSFVGVSGDTEGDLLVYNQSNADVIFASNNSEKLRLDSSGRLLIGTQSTSDNAFLVVKGNVTGSGQQGEMLLLNGASPIEQNYGLGQITFGGGTGDQVSSKIQGFADHDWNTGADGTDSPGRLVFFTTPDGSATPTEKLRISSEGYITKPQNPVFHAFGGPSNVATNTDIVFGQERFDIGNGYNTSTGEYTAPATGYYHFYAQVYRQTTENDAWWGYFLDTGGGYGQISESRLENDYGGDSGRGYSTLQCSIYWYMSAGHKIKCRVGNVGAIHCNNTFSYFCGNLIG